MRIQFVLALLLISGCLSKADEHPQALNRVFSKCEVHDLDLARLAAAAKVEGRITLEVGGKRQEIELQPVRVNKSSSAIHTYRGTIIGEPGSDVRLVVHDRLFFGYVRTPQELLFIDPLYLYVHGESATRVVAYHEADVRPEFRGTCGGAIQAPRMLRSLSQPLATEAVFAQLRQVDIATDADAEFFQNHGEMSDMFIEGIINAVNGLYTSEVGLRFEIVFQNVFTNAANQPYASTDGSTLLSEFQDEWNAHRNGVTRDVAHLFTGKSLDGTTTGIGFLDVVCDTPSFAYALTSESALMSKVTAHEIGHNFGAQHDDEFQPPTAVCDGAGPIMCSMVQVNGPFMFSQRSIDDITAHVANDGQCLSIIPAIQLSVSQTNFPNPAVVGEQVTYSIIASNAGPNDATGVLLTLTISGASVLSVNSSLGNSTNLIDKVTCGPGTLPAGTDSTTALLIAPTRPGSVCVKAKVVADQATFDSGQTQMQLCTTVLLHDFAVVKLKAPKKVVLSGTTTNKIGKLVVTIQNRGANAETIDSLATMENLVTLAVQSLGACPDVVPSLVPPKGAFPLHLARNGKLKLTFTGTFDCANDPFASSKTGAHPDYQASAAVHLSALALTDASPTNDVCPRFPSTGDNGCGNKTPAGTLGGDVLTDVIVK